MAADQNESFTSRKLNWMAALAADTDIGPAAFEVGFCIVQHCNRNTGLAIMSDEAISDETGQSRANVIRARNLLKETEWLEWRRTRTANIYRPRHEKVNRFLDLIVIRRDARRERQARRRRLTRDVSPAKHLNGRDVSPASKQDVSPTTQQDVSPADTNTFRGTPL